MHPEHLLLMRQLVAAVVDMSCTLKTLNSTVGHLVKQQQGSDVATCADAQDCERSTPLSSNAIGKSISDALNSQYSSLPSAAPLTRDFTNENQSSLAESAVEMSFYDHSENTKSPVEITPSPQAEPASESSCAILGPPVIKAEVLSDVEENTMEEPNSVEAVKLEEQQSVYICEDWNQVIGVQATGSVSTFQTEEVENASALHSIESPAGPLSSVVDKDMGAPHAFEEQHVFADVPKECPIYGQQSTGSITPGNEVGGPSNESSSTNTYSCPSCVRVFRFPSDLKRHRKTHMTGKHFSCTVCNKVFLYRSSLEIHSKLHTGQRPHKCGQCNASFKWKQAYQKHMMTHSRQWPFKCSQCGKGVQSWSHLKEHMYSHTGEKPFTCSSCGASFSKKSNLNRHRLTHAR